MKNTNKRTKIIKLLNSMRKFHVLYTIDNFIIINIITCHGEGILDAVFSIHATAVPSDIIDRLVKY